MEIPTAITEHQSMVSPQWHYIRSQRLGDRVYPIWTTPNLPNWGHSGAVLLQDAAHTLQATSGQGASQALEDSVTFSMLLSYYIAKAETPEANLTVEEGIQLAIKALYEIRNPRVTKVRDRARNLYLTNKRIKKIVLEYMYYCFVFIWTNFPIIGLFVLSPIPRTLIVGNVFKELDEWNAQDKVRDYLDEKNPRYYILTRQK
ncbi:MAG: hypothetical protein Q9190_004575 [Brigantiaea leucoxantha]